ncbi:ABC transporter ATP-binding protein [Caballeronia udeis]|uniref:ABC transporter ATP-binding protein n=1 Tax=Caballeronia udeis TaxID=1232866 RepID=A0A158GV14_9BURK|nr:ATP-binding cassette domain-containing protein [Caballeronia udeis]SAL35935.1 ABC transporter ATP-binding protein [Caballeronia udeis]
MNTLSSAAHHTGLRSHEDGAAADALSTSTSLMAVRNLHKWYSGVHALKGASLDFKRGEVVGLLGDNGAGKSTLIKILSGVHRPDEGEILFQGRPVRIPTRSDRDALIEYRMEG